MDVRRRVPLVKYTVVGVYEDSDPIYQRYADTFEADSPEEAETKALIATDDALIVAGVFEGEITAVDSGV
jgi:hypothetical protein